MVLILNCLLSVRARVFEKEIARIMDKVELNTGLYGWRK